MLRNTIVNVLNYYYPLGNTPAVCLTQDLPPEHDADILLLGCGDARSILFTTFADPSRLLDVTCCDIDPAIFARNILLFTLIHDGKADDDVIWNVYYHMKIDSKSLATLQDQLELLLTRSQSLDIWNDTPYGKFAVFCDVRTFTKVTRVWKMWSDRGISEGAMLSRNTLLRDAFRKARDIRHKLHGATALSLSGMRAASPVTVGAIESLPFACNHWWKTGTLEQDQQTLSRSTNMNPTFWSPLNPSNVLHYGQEPLCGFPLAPAYVPLESASEYHATLASTSFGSAVRTAKISLQLWAKAFRASIQLGTVIRFCSADALAMCHSYQAASQTLEFARARVAYDNWTGQMLSIKRTSHGSRRDMPLRFSVIDSSNLIDHLGALNVIVAAGPLLKPGLSSTLYTEVLVQHEDSQAKQLDSILGGDFRTLSLLLGLSPVELWTNASNTSEAEEALVNSAATLAGSAQFRTRLRWKVFPNTTNTSITMKPEALAGLLASVHATLYRHEDMVSMMANMNRALSSMSNPYYTRAGFAALIQYVSKRIDADWKIVMKLFFQILQTAASAVSLTRCYTEELLSYLHIVGVYTAPSLVEQPADGYQFVSMLSSWPSIPKQVAITVEVPRKALSLFAELPPHEVGISNLACALQTTQPDQETIVHLFSAVQVSFARLNRSIEPMTSETHLSTTDEDAQFWTGESPVLISCLAPSHLLLANRDISVRVCLQSTPQTMMNFAKRLGSTLSLFEAPLTDYTAVHVTRDMPNMPGMPCYGAVNSPAQVAIDQGEYASVVTVDVMSEKLASMTGRLDLKSPSCRAGLADKSTSVIVKFPSPLLAQVVVGTRKYGITFPAPVNGSKHRLRIARKSSYVEVVVPLWDPLQPQASAFMFPTSYSKVGDLCSPTTWNSQRVNLDLMPKIDFKDKKKFEWLVTHSSMAWSDRERKYRESGMSGRQVTTDTRAELKDGFFSLLMHFTGVQGARSEYFGLAKDGTAVDVIIVPSAVRLDLVNRSVAVDVALIPLKIGFQRDQKFSAFLAAGAKHNIRNIKVSGDELKSWKAIFPSCVERCRTWKHSAKCEYLATEKIPLSMEDGHAPLCSCGHGKFPPKYITGSVAKFDNFDYVMKKYATRAAISPMFAVSYVEGCYLTDQLRELKKTIPTHVSAYSTDGCRKCGQAKTQEADSKGLLKCSRCKKVKYCSVKCQKADWKQHKVTCAPT